MANHIHLCTGIFLEDTEAFYKKLAHTLMLLANAVPRENAADGSVIPLRALFDQGSQRSFIKWSCNSRIGFKMLKYCYERSIIKTFRKSRWDLNSSWTSPWEVGLKHKRSERMLKRQLHSTYLEWRERGAGPDKNSSPSMSYFPARSNSTVS